MDHLPGLNDVPPAPRTLSPQARALVVGYRGRQGVLLIVGGVFLAVGLILSIVFCWGLPMDAAIHFSRRDTRGTILRVDPTPGMKLSGRRPTKVRFQYEAGGTLWLGESNSFEIRPEQTGAIEVEYSSLNPAWGRLAGETYSTYGYLGMLSLLFPILGALILYLAIRSNRREIRAFTRGFPVLARVTFRGQDHSTTINGRHPFLIRWEFKTETGVYRGSLSSLKLLDSKAFGEADQIVVLYDPADPKANSIFVA